jgi:hypothetical protein
MTFKFEFYSPLHKGVLVSRRFAHPGGFALACVAPVKNYVICVSIVKHDKRKWDVGSNA